MTHQMWENSNVGRIAVSLFLLTERRHGNSRKWGDRKRESVSTQDEPSEEGSSNIQEGFKELD